MIIERDGAVDNILLEPRKGSVQIQITPAQPKTLTHLPKRPKVDLAFSELKYTVRQGKGTFFIYFFYWHTLPRFSCFYFNV